MSDRNSPKESFVGGGNEGEPAQTPAVVSHELKNQDNTAGGSSTSRGATKTGKRACSEHSKNNKVPKKSIAPPSVTAKTEGTDLEEPDPAEPLYCLCQKAAYGEMICCDNDLCPRVWFHAACVGLGPKPRGRWFCPKCRRDGKPNLMKPRAQLIQELVQYNKEMEDKFVEEQNKEAQQKQQPN